MHIWSISFLMISRHVNKQQVLFSKTLITKFTEIRKHAGEMNIFNVFGQSILL